MQSLFHHDFQVSKRNICQVANYHLSVSTQQLPMRNRRKRIAIVIKRGMNLRSSEFVFCKWITSLFLRRASWIIRHPPYSIHVGARGSVNSLVKRGTWSIGRLVWSNTNQGSDSELQHGCSFILQNIVLNFLSCTYAPWRGAFSFWARKCFAGANERRFYRRNKIGSPGHEIGFAGRSNEVDSSARCRSSAFTTIPGTLTPSWNGTVIDGSISHREVIIRFTVGYSLC